MNVAVQKRFTLPPRVRGILLPFFKPTRSVLWPGGLRTFLLVHPIAFEVWFRARALWFLLARRWTGAEQCLSTSWPTPGFFERVFDHNYTHRWLFSRSRTEKLINVLRCVGQVSGDSKILIIGPRNEAELLLLVVYGFKLRNITGIDLFTYTPKIRRMDMHQMDFPGDSFDIVYVSWVLKYSYDLPKACAEILRVVRNGGLVAAGLTQSCEPSAHVGKGSELSGGLDELFERFAPHVDHVYWQDSEPAPVGSGNFMLTTVFRIKKKRGLA